MVIIVMESLFFSLVAFIIYKYVEWQSSELRVLSVVRSDIIIIVIIVIGVVVVVVVGRRKQYGEKVCVREICMAQSAHRFECCSLSICA